VARLEHARVGLRDIGALRELLADPLERRLQRPRVDPGDEAQREEILRAVLLFRVELEVGDGLVREAGHVDLVQAVALGQRGIVQRVLRVAGLVEIALLEGRGVDDQQAAGLEVAKMHLERSRIHRHQAVETVARRVHALAAELQLEAGDAEQRAGRGADLGGEVRQRGDVIARPRRLGGELLARQLHAIAGVSGEADHGALKLAPRFGPLHGRRRLAHRFPLLSLVVIVQASRAPRPCVVRVARDLR